MPVIQSPGVLATTRPLVFAHRGGRAVGPENTLPGFDAGLAAGADGLELDVQLSSDGRAVVIHDATLDRTTDATGPVGRHSAAELARIDATRRYGVELERPWPGARAGVATLDDVLARYPETPLIIEMKADHPALARAVVAAVRAAGAEARVCLGAFASRVIRDVRLVADDIATSACREEVRLALHRSWIGLGPGRRCPYRAFQVPERAGWLTVVTPRFVRAVHQSGCAVQVWTVNGRADMARLLSWGVDGLITDDPALAAEVRDAHVASRR